MIRSHQRRKRKRRIKRNRRVIESKYNKMINQYKSEAKEATDAILMDVMNQGGRDFKDYKEEVLDWSWDSIIDN